MYDTGNAKDGRAQHKHRSEMDEIMNSPKTKQDKQERMARGV
jgi:hypothetical protein